MRRTGTVLDEDSQMNLRCGVRPLSATLRGTLPQTGLFCPHIHYRTGNVCARGAQVVNGITMHLTPRLLCAFKRRPHSLPFFGGLQTFPSERIPPLFSHIFPQPHQSGIYHPGDAAAAPRSFRYELYLITSGLFHTTPPIVNTTGPVV